jgi:hypothetical protein
MVRESTKGKSVSNVKVEIMQKKSAVKVSTLQAYMHILTLTFYSHPAPAAVTFGEGEHCD